MASPKENKKNMAIKPKLSYLWEMRNNDKENESDEFLKNILQKKNSYWEYETSLKSIDREGLGESRTGTRQAISLKSSFDATFKYF